MGDTTNTPSLYIVCAYPFLVIFNAHIFSQYTSSCLFFFFLSFYFLIWEVGIIIPCLQASQNLIEHFQYSLKFLLYRKGFCGQLGLGSPVAQRLKRLHPLEKERATHSSTLAWEISWTEEPGVLQSKGLQSQTRLSEHTGTHSMWDLSSLTREDPVFPALEVRRLNSWSTREVPCLTHLSKYSSPKMNSFSTYE